MACQRRIVAEDCQNSIKASLPKPDRRGSSQRWLWCGALLSVAIALKGYPVVLLLVPLALRKVRFTISVAVASIAINIVSLFAIPGGFSRNLSAAIPALTSQKLTNASQLNTWGAYSLIPKIVGLLRGTSHVAGLLNPHGVQLWAIPAAYLTLVFFIIWMRRVPQWCWGPLSLASLQLVPPLSGIYTTGWACLAAVWFCRGSIVPVDSSARADQRSVNDEVALRVVVGLAIAASLVPSIFSLSGAGGLSVPATELLSPALLIIAVLLATARTLSGRTMRRREAPEQTGAELDETAVPVAQAF